MYRYYLPWLAQQYVACLPAAQPSYCFGYAEHGPEDLVDLQGRGLSLWFQELPAEKPLRHAFHIDVSVPRAVGRARVDAALAAGGRIADTDHRGWWTLADPAGNKVDIGVVLGPTATPLDEPTSVHAGGKRRLVGPRPPFSRLLSNSATRIVGHLI